MWQRVRAMSNMIRDLKTRSHLSLKVSSWQSRQQRVMLKAVDAIERNVAAYRHHL
jgi:hypothetical protein